MSSAENTQKRRKVHLDRVDCFTFARNTEGGINLTNPLLHVANTSKKRQNLLPNYKTRKNTMKKSLASGASDFQSAAGFHKQETCPEFPIDESRENGLRSSVGQTSISSYIRTKNRNPNVCAMDKSNISIPSDVICISDDDATSKSPRAGPSAQHCKSQSGTPSKMYSPIKLLKNSTTIYVSDSESLTSSQKSENGHKEELSRTDVVKALFEGQRNLSKNSQTKKRKRGENKKTCPSLSKVPKTTLFCKDLGDMNSSDDDVLSTAEEKTDSKFGLLGHQPQEKINYFSKLPDELLQKVFCQLPILDLCLNCNRVCVRWNEVISQEKVILFKISIYLVLPQRIIYSPTLCLFE